MRNSLIILSFILSTLGAQTSFVGTTIATSADIAKSVKIADLDGDGDLDIIGVSEADDALSWYENDGAANPTFTAADIATNIDGAMDVFLADMDNDGDLDIVTASNNDDKIACFVNNGAADPSFSHVSISTGADGAQSVYVADMDNDGDLDIVSASMNDNTIAWYENDGAATPQFSAADIATSASQATSLVVADLDGDGDMDIISSSQGDDAIAWYENNGAADPSWTAADIATSADEASQVIGADIDNDGDFDIISTSHYDDAVSYYINNGASDPSWSASDITTTFDMPTSVWAGDLDGDGDMDLAVASMNDDKVSWLENNLSAYGTPSFTSSNITTSADGVSSVYAADIDSDGDMDVLSASYNDDKIAWYESDGA